MSSQSARVNATLSAKVPDQVSVQIYKALRRGLYSGLGVSLGLESYLQNFRGFRALSNPFPTCKDPCKKLVYCIFFKPRNPHLKPQTPNPENKPQSQKGGRAASSNDDAVPGDGQSH